MPPATPSALPPLGARLYPWRVPLPTSVPRPVPRSHLLQANLPAARRLCQRLRAMSSESWHPPGCAPTSIQGPRAGGATQRLAGRLACLRSKSPRVHARIAQLAGFPLVPSQLRQGDGKERGNLPVLRDAATGDPFPAASVPRQLCLAARRAAGAARLLRAPRELLPGRAQVRLSQHRCQSDRAGQSRRSLEPAEGPPPRPHPHLHPSSPLRVLHAPPALGEGPDLWLPRFGVRRGAS